MLTKQITAKIPRETALFELLKAMGVTINESNVIDINLLPDAFPKHLFRPINPSNPVNAPNLPNPANAPNLPIDVPVINLHNAPNPNPANVPNLSGKKRKAPKPKPFFNCQTETQTKRVNSVHEKIKEAADSWSLTSDQLLEEMFKKPAKRDELVKLNEAVIEQSPKKWADQVKKVQKEEILQEYEETASKTVKAKDECHMSDGAYQCWRTILDQAAQVIPSLNILKECRAWWNEQTAEKMLLQNILGLSGKRVPTEKIVMLTARLAAAILEKTPAHKRVVQQFPRELLYKVSVDARKLSATKWQVLIGLIPMNMGFRIHSPRSVFPVVIYEGKETVREFCLAMMALSQEIKELSGKGIEINGLHHPVHFCFGSDMSSMWVLSQETSEPRSLSGKCCPKCHADQNEEDWKELDNWKSNPENRKATNMLGIDPDLWCPCQLHAILRVTEKLLNHILQYCHDENVIPAFEDSMKNHFIPTFFVYWRTNRSNLPEYSMLSGDKAYDITNGFEKILKDVSRDWQKRLTRTSRAQRQSEIDPKLENLARIWSHWKKIVELMRNLRNLSPEEQIARLEPEIQTWGQLYQLHYRNQITPYIHLIYCHWIDIMREQLKFGVTMKDMSQEGFEAAHKYHKMIYWRNTMRDGGRNQPTAIEQMMLFIYRGFFLELELADGIDPWKEVQAKQKAENGRRKRARADQSRLRDEPGDLQDSEEWRDETNEHHTNDENEDMILDDLLGLDHYLDSSIQDTPSPDLQMADFFERGLY